MDFLNNHHVNRLAKELFGLIIAGAFVVYADEPMFLAAQPLITRARSMIARHFGWEEC